MNIFEFKVQQTILLSILLLNICFPVTGKAQGNSIQQPLIAKQYYSGFELAYGTWNAVSSASDGKIYYCLSSQYIDVGGQLYVYDPSTDKTEHLDDLTDICGESDLNAIPQGKIHTNFYESKGKLYFATHAGFYELVDGMEKMTEHPSEGKRLYPGGHFVSYDLSTGEFEDLQIAPEREAIVTMTMDTLREQIYAISWPHGYFLHYNVRNDQLKNLGQFTGNGEAGIQGEDYRVLCRSMVVDPRDGNVYFSSADGDIFTYGPDLDSFKKVEGVNLRLDYFGKWDITRPGSMGYGWRRIVWYPPENVAYGLHGGSGYLFRFDPWNPSIELVERLTSEPSKRSGMYDQFVYGYLGFKLAPDGENLYYLTGGPIFVDGQRLSGNEKTIAAGPDRSSGTWAGRGLENLHLVTYNIPHQKYIDHGPIFYEDGTRPLRVELVHYVNALAIGPCGNIYTCAQFEHNGKVIEDLVKIPNPFK